MSTRNQKKIEIKAMRYRFKFTRLGRKMFTVTIPSINKDAEKQVLSQLSVQE